MQKEVLLAEREFFNTLLELNHTDRENQKQVILKAQNYAQQIPDYSKWPFDKQQFWNAEAICWRTRLSKEKRAVISNELSSLTGLNLDLGAGSHSYVKNSIAIDFSPEMLHLNNTPHKVVADLEKPLTFHSEIFDSITAIFIFNYIKNAQQLIKEAKRVLQVGGQFIIAIADNISPLHQLHYQNNYGPDELKILLKNNNFIVDSYTKNNITFILAKKGIN